MSEEVSNIKYYYQTIEEDSFLSDLLSDTNYIFLWYKDKQTDFLNIKVEDKTNLERIWEHYTPDYQGQFKTDHSNNTLSLVLSGTTLCIPEGAFPSEQVAAQGRGLFWKAPITKDGKVTENNFKGFWTAEYQALNNDPGYVPAKEIGTGTPLIYKNFYCSVWLYRKSTDDLSDITPYISGLDTSMAFSGGTFTIDILPYQEEVVITRGEDSVSRFDLHRNGKLNVPDIFKTIQQNDLVYIRFERLVLEKDRNTKLNNTKILYVNDIPGKVYDMMGLIDSPSISYNINSTDVTISLHGRDFSKLLAEDETHFYPLAFIDKSALLQLNASDDGQWFKRNFITKVFDDMFVFSIRSIKDSIGFIFNQLSNISVVSDHLFDSYDQSNEQNQNNSRLGKRRTQVINITAKDEREYASWNVVKGIWQVVDVFFDEENLSDRTQCNSQFYNPDSNLLQQVNGVCQYPFAEFFGDTYGDKYCFIARQPIFTKVGINSFIQNNTLIDIRFEDLLAVDLNWETQYYSAYIIEPSGNFLGYDSMTSLGYIPVVYLTKYAENFGNKQYQISDTYISRVAFEGGNTQNGVLYDNFKQQVVNDLCLAISTQSYLPFTQKGTITLNGDRRIKIGTWIRFKPTDQIFFVDSVNQNLTFTRQSIDRTTTISVSRGMKEKYVTGEVKETIDGQEVEVSYFNIVDTSVIYKTVMANVDKGNFDEGTQETTRKPRETYDSPLSVKDYIFDFFLKRKEML
jgi:hypothetical protein